MHKTQERKPVSHLDPAAGWKPLGLCVVTTPKFEVMDDEPRRTVRPLTTTTFVMYHCDVALGYAENASSVYVHVVMPAMHMCCCGLAFHGALPLTRFTARRPVSPRTSSTLQTT